MFFEMSLCRPYRRQLRLGLLFGKFKMNDLRSPSRMFSPQVTERVHCFGRSLSRLVLATTMVVGIQCVLSRFAELRIHFLNKSSGEIKLQRCLFSGNLLFPELKKELCELDVG